MGCVSAKRSSPVATEGADYKTVFITFYMIFHPLFFPLSAIGINSPGCINICSLFPILWTVHRHLKTHHRPLCL